MITRAAYDRARARTTRALVAYDRRPSERRWRVLQAAIAEQRETMARLDRSLAGASPRGLAGGFDNRPRIGVKASPEKGVRVA